MHSKKGQISGQIFIYIISIIVSSTILLYGYFAIAKIRENSCKIDLLKFQSELNGKVRDSRNYGNSRIYDFYLSCGYEEICFVDLKKIEYAKSTDLCSPGNGDYRPIVCDAWQSNASNVFLKPMSSNPIFIEKITVDGNDDGKEDGSAEFPFCKKCLYLCQQIKNGKLRLRFEGKGDRTLIRRG